MNRVGRVCLLFVLIASVAGCSRDDDSHGLVVAAGSATTQPAAAEPAPTTPTPTTPQSAPSSAVPAPKPAPTATPRAGTGLSAADRRAGLRSKTVAGRAGGHLRTVPGERRAPGKGRIYTVKVEVESDLDVDRTAFANFVLNTLNDKRSWTEHGKRRFARTDDARADIQVILASPATSAAICRPLRTFGKLSCRHGANSAVLTYYRWVKAIPEYAANPEGYRHYVVNHEVGHVLGHGHEYCARRGAVAPVMMQQTKGLRGCRPNPWPHP